MKHYKGYKGIDVLEDDALHWEFERLKTIAMQQKTDVKVGVADLCEFIFCSISYRLIYTVINVDLYIFPFRCSRYGCWTLYWGGIDCIFAMYH